MCAKMIAHLVVLSVDERPTTSFTPAIHVTDNYSCRLWPSKQPHLGLRFLSFVVWSKRSQKMLTNTYWYHSRWVTSSHQKNSRTLLSPYKMRSLLRLTTRLSHSFGKLSFATPHLTPLEAPRKLSNPREKQEKRISVRVGDRGVTYYYLLRRS